MLPMVLNGYGKGLKYNLKKKTNGGIFQDLHCRQERGFCIDPTGNGIALQKFQQPTKLYWLSLGPSIVRLLKQ